VEKKLKKYQAKLDELKIACDAKTRQISKLRHQNVNFSVKYFERIYKPANKVEASGTLDEGEDSTWFTSIR